MATIKEKTIMFHEEQPRSIEDLVNELNDTERHYTSRLASEYESLRQRIDVAEENLNRQKKAYNEWLEKMYLYDKISF
jgi:uncharacterized protein YdcH (DUF465 family)